MTDIMEEAAKARSEIARELWELRRKHPAMARLLARRLKRARDRTVHEFWYAPPDNSKDGLAGLIP